MKLKIEIQMDNSAFADAPMIEVARILHEYAKQIERSGEPTANLRDVNGNKVGTADVWE